MGKHSRRAACAILVAGGWLLFCVNVRAALEEATSEGALPPYASSFPFELQSRVERASFHLRRPEWRAVYNAIAQAYGIRLLYDRDLGEPRLVSDFQLDNVTLQEALDAAGNISKTFVAPVDDHTGVVAPDTAQKRGEYERQVLGRFQMDGLTTAQQLTEISTALRTLVDLRRVSQDTASNRISAMGRTRQMAAARQFVRTLQKDRGEVMVDVDLLEIDSQRARQLGILPPQPFQLLYLGLAGGAASVPVLTFGGGRTFYGLNLPGATATLTYSSSAVRSYQNLQLRADDGQQTSLLLGERYPIINGIVSPSFFSQPTQQGSQGLSQGSISNTVNLTVAMGAAGPSISSITTSPNPPLIGQQFNFTIGGSGFDPSSAQVLFTGPGCSPCTVPNGALSVTTTSITGPATLSAAGSYTVATQNNTGALSNTLSVTVGSAGLSISTITTSPNLPVAGQQFGFTISGSGFDPFTAQVLITGPGCSPCTVANGLLSVTSTSIAGPATLNYSGVYNLVVQNGNGSTSNTGNITVSTGTGGPSFSSIATSPDPPVVGQQFTFTINGSGFDPLSAQVLFSGPACSPCVVPTAQLNVISTSITGLTTLANSGTFSVAVQNSFGLPSNTLSLTVSTVGLSVSSITTSPSPPVAGQQFNFTINGDGFDPSNAQVLFTGVGCSPCTIPHGALTVTTTSITGPATLNTAGNYSVAVQNASGLPTSISSNPTANLGFYPSIQYEDLGVAMKATPYLHAGRELTLKFDLTVRNLGGQSLNGTPIISNRQVTEQVRLRDGDSYLIGGILNTSEVASVNGYPFLSRLPILGTLFGTRNKQQTETEFLMLIRPHVVRLSAAEVYSSNLIYFGKELQGLPPETAPVVPPPAAPAPGAPGAPGVPQPGVVPQPGFVPQPGVPPQPGAVVPQPGAVPQFPQGVQPPGFPGVAPGQPGLPGFIQPVPPNPGGQPQTFPPQGVPQPGQFPPGVVPPIPPQPAQPQPEQEQR